MCNIIPTSQIVLAANYKDSPAGFFSGFSDAWRKVKGQVIKLETRQVYREPGNPSFEELEKGNFEKAVELLPEARENDVELYRQLSERNIDFVRCRPVVAPLSTYLRWEIGCYDFNAKHGERIFFTDRSSVFDEYALHDFMVFDRETAFIHNYDEQGEIRGGWIINDKNHIDILTMMFSIIKASSVHYVSYMKSHSIDIG